jgi:5-oxoprolinase (ATP-hydrolysing)
MSRIIVPYNAGILSAQGILHSIKEALIHKQVLLPVEEAELMIPALIKQLSNKGKEQLIADGVSGNNLIIKEIRLYLRLVGQEHTIEIFYKDGMILKMEFLKSYVSIFNYRPTDLKIELESIRIIVSEIEEKIKCLDLPIKKLKLKPHFIQTAILNPDLKYDGYKWDKLKEGDEISGPALVLNDNASIFLEKGWNLQATFTKDLIISRQRIDDNSNLFKQEAILLELFQNRFQAIAEGMGVQLQRTAMSINIRERLDFSCAILDASGNLIVNAPHIPVHLGSLGFCAKMILQSYALNKGDILLTNHPAFGGSHLPDLTLIAPVFDQNDKLIAFVLNRAHHAEIGGLRPGSMSPDAKNLEEEGVIFLPFYLAINDQYKWSKLRDMLHGAIYPSRRVDENIADLKSAVASLKYGQDKLKDLSATYGSDNIEKYMNNILDRSERILTQIIYERKNFDKTCVEYMDDGTKIQLRIKVIEGLMYFDFSGSSKPHSGNLNANKSIIYSAVMYALRLLAIEDIPLNDGLMRKVKIVLPESFLSPNFPEIHKNCPAVAGGNTEVSQRVVDCIIRCFGLSACSQGTMNNFLFGNQKFSYYETIGGGVGAGPGFNGRSGIHQHMTNTRITDPEDLEYRFPVVLKEFSIRENSGGHGKWKGGNGLVRKVEFLEDMEVTILSQHRNEAPYGLLGGENGKKGRQFIVRNDGKIDELKAMDQTLVKAGESISIETPGGGGFGNIENLNTHD